MERQTEKREEEEMRAGDGDGTKREERRAEGNIPWATEPVPQRD